MNDASSAAAAGHSAVLRRFLVACLVVALGLGHGAAAPALAHAQGASTVIVYVAPGTPGPGDGSLGSPYNDLQTAVDDVARRYNTTGDASTQYVIKMAGGTYQLSSGVTISGDQFDGGTTPWVTIEPLSGQNVTVSGLQQLDTSLFRVPTDSETLARIRPEVQGQILEADLAALAIPNLAEPRDLTRVLFPFDLHANGTTQPIARFPNGDETNHLRMGPVLHNGSTAPGDGGIFTYKESIDRHEVWADALAAGRQVWLKGFWRVAWQLEAFRVEAFDTDAATVEFIEGPNSGIGSKYHRPSGSGLEPYWAENLLEEIDAPGEWSIDFSTQKMYYLPPAPIGSVELTITAGETPLLTATDMNNFTVRGISFIGAKTNAIEIRGGEQNTVHGCEVRQSLHGIALLDGLRNRVVSCDIYDIGGTGITVRGDLSPRTPLEHEILNNHIYDVANKLTIYHSGIALYGAGTRVAHNVIHDVPHMGIGLSGYDHVLEYNEIYNWSQVSNDIGAVYSYLSEDASGGFIVRHNYAHDAPTADGIYFDQHDVDTQVYSNLVVNTYRAYLFKIDRDHHIRDNIAIASGTAYWVPMTPGSVLERNVSIDSPRHVFLPGASAEQNEATLTPSIADLGFADAANGDYRVDPNARIFRDVPTFAPIDFANVGFYADEYRSVDAAGTRAGDADCDGSRGLRDALMIAQYAVALRSAGSCPLADATAQINPAAGDVNSDGVASPADAVLILQCNVGLGNELCPRP